MTVSIDLYCRVVDNFGDAGICWRLARQLRDEHRARVRLIIDKPGYIEKLENLGARRDTPLASDRLNAMTALFEIAGVPIFDWQAPPPIDDLPQVVIAAFQCELPAALRERVAASQSLWINLDYLSAEPWVDDVHGRPSHKGDGGVEWFFLPGFTARSGGLIREHSVALNREHGETSIGEHGAASPRALARGTVAGLDRPAWWTPPRNQALSVSLFCYGGQPLGELLQCWRRADATPVDLWVTAGCDLADVRRQLGLAPDSIRAQIGPLQVRLLPWLAQSEYDRLLASCDLNFVRGEDSWIRAIWAGKPFIWRPYPQEDGAHRIKLDAFVDRLGPHFEAAQTTLIREFMHAWTAGQGCGRLWPKWLELTESMKPGFAQFRQALRAQPDLACRLIQFVEQRLAH